MICEEVDIKVEPCEEITVSSGISNTNPDLDLDLPNSSIYVQSKSKPEDESYSLWILDQCDGACGHDIIQNDDPDLEPNLTVRKHRVVHKCDECGRICATQSALRIHSRSHSGEKPYKCEECGSSFVGAGNLRRHIKEVHEEHGVTTHKPKNFICVTCGKGFVRTTQLNCHLKTHLTHEQRAIGCPHKKCSKRFNTPAQLRHHLKTHSVEKPLVCDFEGCTLRYKSAEGLRHHKLSHVGPKPYVCRVEDCGKSYSYLSVLRGHERSKHSIGIHNYETEGESEEKMIGTKILTEFSESESECCNEIDPLQLFLV